MNKSNDQLLSKAEFLDEFRKKLSAAQILDNTYPVQGSHVLLPYGYQLKNMLFSEFINSFERLFFAKRVDIPLRIPPDFLGIHSPTANVKDNPDYLDQVPCKPVGSAATDQPPFFRGALDFGLYHILKRSILSYRDLPQTWLTRGLTLRNDSGIPLARDPEVEFVEGIMAILPEKEKLNDFIELILGTMVSVFERLEIPVIPLWKPAFAERFPGNMTIKLFTYIPGTKAVISVGIIHFFNDRPAKFFNVQVQNLKQENVYPWIMNFGITQRVLFAYLVHHADHQGFVFPPGYSPVPLSVVLRSKKSEINENKNKMDRILLEHLQGHNMIFYSPYKPIKKTLILSEAQGIPLRIEAGSNEFNSGNMIVFNRYIGRKDNVPIIELRARIESELMQLETLFREKFIEKQKYLDNWVDNVLVQRTIACDDCQRKIEEETRVLGRDIKSQYPGILKCQYCNSQTGVTIYTGDYW
ncbi:MAG: hypothetical protein ACTSRU_14840 [Candidatus Hodarchaeales archaeon]